MGRNRARKKERRAAQRGSQGRWGAPVVDLEPDPFGNDALLAFMPDWAHEETATVTACGTCMDFVEDGDGGRGTCLHPASGVLAPWTDTPGCDFWRRR